MEAPLIVPMEQTEEKLSDDDDSNLNETQGQTVLDSADSTNKEQESDNSEESKQAESSQIGIH